MTIEAILKKVPFFTQLSGEQIAHLAGLGKVTKFDANTHLFHEGDSGENMYIVAAGSVRIYKSAESGIESEISVAHQGDFFGELALLDSHPRSASGITLSACELF